MSKPYSCAVYAKKNMDALLKDLDTMGAKGLRYERDRFEDSDNREYGFVGFALHHPSGIKVRLLMPGVPLEQVRFLDRRSKGWGGFPQIYLDVDCDGWGSWWWWPFLLDHLGPEEWTELFEENKKRRNGWQLMAGEHQETIDGDEDIIEVIGAAADLADELGRPVLIAARSIGLAEMGPAGDLHVSPIGYKECPAIIEAEKEWNTFTDY